MKANCLVLIAIVSISAGACHSSSVKNDPSSSAPGELTRERAIEIARPQAKFQPATITAEKTTDSGKRVWRVTFRGAPADPANPLREILIVLIDRQTGEVVSIAQS